jgi:hypothetical protein
MQRKENFFSDFNHKTQWDILFDLSMPDDREALGVSTAEEYKKSFQAVLEQVGEVVGSKIVANQIKVSKEDLKLVDGEVEYPPAITESVNLLKELGVASMGIASRFFTVLVLLHIQISLGLRPLREFLMSMVLRSKSKKSFHAWRPASGVVIWH